MLSENGFFSCTIMILFLLHLQAYLRNVLNYLIVAKESIGAAQSFDSFEYSIADGNVAIRRKASEKER